MRIVLSDRDPSTLAADVLWLPFTDAQGVEKLPLRGKLGKEAATLAPLRPDSCAWVSTRRARAHRALLARLPVQIGPEDLDGGACGSANDQDVALGRRRDLLAMGATLEQLTAADGFRRVVLHTADDLELGLDLIEGAVLRAYAFDELTESTPGLRQLTWAVPKEQRKAARLRLDRLKAKLEGMQLARTLCDLPPNYGEPEAIVDRVRPVCEAAGLQMKVLGREEITELEMGLFVGVARGAQSEPRLLVLEHRPESVEPDAAPALALVGKGVTIDAGGYNLKSSGIHDMNYDKAGASAVIGAMLAIARARLPVHVVAACPLVENLLGSDAMRPGEILRAYDGRTVFIENADAEGRLILADVLAWLGEREPERVVDLATLTGAANIALGEPYAALFTNDDALRDVLLVAGERADELLWPMPVHDLHDRELAHPRADLRNVGSYAGGASAAAAFLRYFASGAWAHIDLAGKGAHLHERDYLGPGASGFGTRLLFELVSALADD